ncbi:SDR family NAD(P)-dependent oxidoreductase [Mangrovicoccus algicola]|uniref:SDR family oxidoreductase n=1 Tax=Mangrovicoccus algicola TaxID=2771008 RepID=A0A8J7CHH1_9RHOB|nr:SDR family oxidoreductase [Mangrovicoccus algicola]MBE3638160.1 SDR family oxidoreductase [Mangrovicoccus algicola]
MTSPSTRTVLITGAASGIGAALARKLAGPGISLFLHTGRNGDALEAVAAECRALGARTGTCTGDLSQEETCLQLVAAARARFGTIDQIVANAGKARKATFSGMTRAALMADFALMPAALASLVTAALPDLCASPRGRVVAVSSFVAHVHGKGGHVFASTSAAKAALEALIDVLALELAPHGATANCVVPGFTRKEGGGHAAIAGDSHAAVQAATPTGRMSEPAEIAAAIAFLLGDEAGQITGARLQVDGGLRLG